MSEWCRATSRQATASKYLAYTSVISSRSTQDRSRRLDPEKKCENSIGVRRRRRKDGRATYMSNLRIEHAEKVGLTFAFHRLSVMRKRWDNRNVRDDISYRPDRLRARHTRRNEAVLEVAVQSGSRRRVAGTTIMRPVRQGVEQQTARRRVSPRKHRIPWSDMAPNRRDRRFLK